MLRICDVLRKDHSKINKEVMKIIPVLTIGITVLAFSFNAALAGSGSSTPLTSSSKQETQPKGTISVISATYGANCTKKSVKGNVTDHLKITCNGQSLCEYKVDVGKIGDPFYGCAKTYVAEYSCGGKTLKAELAAEASYQTEPLILTCGTASKSTTKTSTKAVKPATTGDKQ